MGSPQPGGMPGMAPGEPAMGAPTAAVLPPLEGFARTEQYFLSLMKQRRETLSSVESQLSGVAAAVGKMREKNALVSSKIAELMVAVEGERTKWRLWVVEEQRILCNRLK